MPNPQPDDPVRCQAGTDGDCNWKDCPQKKEYQRVCPLYVNLEREEL